MQVYSFNIDRKQQGGAPLLALFEKGPDEPQAVGRPGIPRPAKRSVEHSGLTPVFSNDGDLHTQGAQNGIDSFKAWMCACAQGFVEALPAQSGFFGDLRHASRFRHVAERGNEYIGVWVFGSRRKIFRNDGIVIEISCRVERFVACFSYIHPSFSLYPIGYFPAKSVFEGRDPVITTQEKPHSWPRSCQA